MDIYDAFGDDHLTLSIHDEFDTVIGDEFEEDQDLYSGWDDDDEFDEFDQSHDMYDEFDDDEFDDIDDDDYDDFEDF